MDKAKSSQVLAFLRRKALAPKQQPQAPKVEVEIETEGSEDDVESLKAEIARLKMLLGQR